MVEKFIQIAGLFLAETIIDIRPLHGGLINATYKVQTEKNQCFVLQRINANVFPDAHAIQRNMQRVGEFLQQSGYPKEILIPMHLKSGALFYVDAQNDAWRMFRYLENTACYQHLANDEFAENAAKALGELHGYLAQMSAGKLSIHLPEFTNFSARLLQFEHALVVASPDRLAMAEKDISLLSKHSVIVDCFVELQAKLPMRIIHGDPKLSNFLFEKDGAHVVALIDLDTLMPGTVLYDFGDMARSFCSSKNEESSEENGFNNQIYNVIKSSYLKSASDFLTPLETQSMDLAAAAVMTVQAHRFLTDFLQGDVYYHIDHPMQNLHRAQNQRQVLEGFLEKVDLILPTN
jgi:Ser/Thr protein kinase RdoA (MazF antagonist)